MSRVLVALCLLVTGSSGWWGNTTEPEPDGPWKAWVRQKSPALVVRWEQTAATLESMQATVNEWTWGSWDMGLWSICDGVLGLAGWGLFGSAWGDVRNGCRRLLQVAVVLTLCIVAHYVWAICWPVVSLLIAVLMTMVWAVRKLVRVLGGAMYYLQKAFGGTPEAVDAEYYGPGTGRTPETAELRRFKSSSGQEKWIVVKRGQEVAVFKLGCDTQAIRSSGLYVPVEGDSLRGTSRLVSELRGCDRVHLCRNETCPEEGQHFQTYGLAKKYDPEKFELAVATQGAKEAGQTLWKWAWAGTQAVKTRLADYGSESESETVACMGHRICWATETGDVRLSVGPCTEPAREQIQLLVEDEFQPGSVVHVCATHAAKYVTQRYIHKCSQTGCKRLGRASASGVHMCWTHEHESSSRRSRSRSRDRRARGEGGEVHEGDGEHGGDPSEPRDPGIQKLLAEVRDMKESIQRDKEGKETEEVHRRKRLASRSPGVTPKSTVHRSLARLGMLDSPDGDHRNWLEDFFDRYTQGRDLGLTEEQTRRAMAEDKGIGFSELSRVLHGLATAEQAKGQKGLSKFLTKWKGDFEDEDRCMETSPDTSSLARSWSVVPSESPSKVSTPPGLSAAVNQVAERAGTPLVVGPPSIFGKGDRRAGATGSAAADPVTVIAQAIQSQTAEIASLVKAQAEQTHHPQGTLRGLNRLSEEMVFILRACDQYSVAVCPCEVGSALANGFDVGADWFVHEVESFGIQAEDDVPSGDWFGWAVLGGQ